MKYVNSLKYMNSFAPSESHSDISASRTAQLCELLGRVNINTKSIFIPSGSTGYMTSVMLESVIKSEGYRVGRITSEFGFDCRKMVYIDGAPASIEDFNRAVAELKSKVISVPDQCFLREEAAFALSLLLCRMNDCRYIILEGMSSDSFDLSSLCAPYDIVIVPEIKDENDRELAVVCRAISQGSRAIVSANQKVTVYNKLATVAKTGITVTAKKSFESWHISGLRQDFAYGTREGYTIKSPSIIGRESAMLVIDAALSIRRDGIKVQWSNIEAGLAVASNMGSFDVFSVSPLMVFDSACDADGVWAIKTTAEAVLGGGALEHVSLCAPISAIAAISRFEGIDKLIIVGDVKYDDISWISANSVVCCKTLKSAAKELNLNIKSGKNTVALGSVAFALELKEELTNLIL